ncbi:97 kDa heat shock protein [Folsomia candida]|uniref:97 kDa heat shock protein n=1 Tax=Folsomia candida TaxID=158441 RepID=A0A226EC42_FOLCA|nr:97 kDa heat shock protein [Folsomia candida]
MIGIDIGNQSSFVAVLKDGGVETVDNDYSLRATSSVVAFSSKNRILGVAAANQQTSNLTNTISSFKPLLGWRWEDFFVLDELQRVPYKLVPHPSGGVAVQVCYFGEERVYSIEDITAMLLTGLKETTETVLKSVIKNCVMAVPSYFTDPQRRALQAATKIAGINVLQLLSEPAAVSLAYGYYREDLPGEDEAPRNVAFVDCGHLSLQVWVCAFNEGNLKILTSDSSPSIGGRDFDSLLAHHFCTEFQNKYKIQPETNRRSYARLLTELEKVKKSMSSNAGVLPLKIESLLDDRDVSGKICRAEFETMSQSLFKRVETTLQNCLNNSKLQPRDIHSVEIVGGTTRIPAIKDLISKVFKKSVSTTLNQDESVAKGCALQCAILSKSCGIKPFKVQDIQYHSIRIVWDESLQEDGWKEVVPLNGPVPYSDSVTLHKQGNSFKFKVMCPLQEIGDYSVNNFGYEVGDTTELRLDVGINTDGIFSLNQATAFHKNDECVKKRARIKSSLKLDRLPITAKRPGLTEQDVQDITKIENEMIALDRKERSRLDVKNELEEYLYKLRDRTRDDSQVDIPDLEMLQNWLYEDGCDEQEEAYHVRLRVLKVKI